MPEILTSSAHRPWQLPKRPWLMYQRWHDLLFAHWAFDPNQVRPLVPRELELDSFDGKAWVGVIPFWMSHVRFRGMPPIPSASTFPELNVRTYVRAPPERDKPGVYFFSLDAASGLAVRAARAGAGLPYFCGGDVRRGLLGRGPISLYQATFAQACPAGRPLSSDRSHVA